MGERRWPRSRSGRPVGDLRAHGGRCGAEAVRAGKRGPLYGRRDTGRRGRRRGTDATSPAARCMIGSAAETSNTPTKRLRGAALTGPLGHQGAATRVCTSPHEARRPQPFHQSRIGSRFLPPDLSFEDAPSPAPPGSAEALRRQAWARMLRKVFEVDPLVCPRCGVEMEVVKGSRSRPSSTRSSGTAASTGSSPRSRRARRRRRSRRAGRSRASSSSPSCRPSALPPRTRPRDRCVPSSPTPCRDGTRGTTMRPVVARGGRGPWSRRVRWGRCWCGTRPYPGSGQFKFPMHRTR